MTKRQSAPHCDTCGQRADTVHLLDRGEPFRYPDEAEHVAIGFACPVHDLGGYWLPLADLSDPSKRADWQRQLRGKTWRGDVALIRAGLLDCDERTEPITVSASRINEQLVVSCPWCGRQHRHGLGDGHRVAHCGEHRNPGYLVREVS